MRPILIITFLLASTSVLAQKFYVQKGKVTFFSEAPLEDITAVNSKASGLLDAKTMEFAFSVPIKAFQFQKSLMQEHFNEKYMESDKYPRSTFTGKILDVKQETLEEQQVHARGNLTIHGVTREVDIQGTIMKTARSWVVNARFPVKLAEYNVKIPEIMWQKIAEEVEVTVQFTLNPQ